MPFVPHAPKHHVRSKEKNNLVHIKRKLLHEVSDFENEPDESDHLNSF